MEDYQKRHRLFDKQLNKCIIESHFILDKLGIVEYDGNHISCVFRVEIGRVRNDKYEVSISVPRDSNFGYSEDPENLKRKVKCAEILLIKNDEMYYNSDWGYDDVRKFWGDTRASDDKNVDALKQEIERLRNCVIGLSQ